MKSLFEKKKPPPAPAPRLTVDQIEATIDAHRLGGMQDTKNGNCVVCFCGQSLVGPGLRGHRRHIAEQIATLQADK